RGRRRGADPPRRLAAARRRGGGRGRLQPLGDGRRAARPRAQAARARPGAVRVGGTGADRRLSHPRDLRGARLRQRGLGDPPRRPGAAGPLGHLHAGGAPARRHPRTRPGGMLMTGYVRNLALKAREAATRLATLDGAARAALLQSMADAVDAGRDTILQANARDMERARGNGTTGAMLDRLELDPGRIDGIVQAIREVAVLPDPVGQGRRTETRANGRGVDRVRSPLGRTAMIYEARPNVTADAAALCLRAGNAVLLRGGSEARDSNIAIARCLHSALEQHGLPREAV